MLGNIRISQALACISSIAALILLFAVGSKVKRMGSDYVFYKDTEESRALIASDAAAKTSEAKSTTSSEETAKDNAAPEESAAPIEGLADAEENKETTEKSE
jgi:hypothetical protein